jgi:hypothetical protein
MWGDTLFAIERLHLLRLLAWSAASIIAGTTILVVTLLRRARPDLLRAFAVQCAAWGVLVLALAGARFMVQTIPDLATATWIERFAWLQAGLYTGLIITGVAIAATGWRAGRSLSAVGTGAGVMVQGAGLLVFDLLLVAQIAR